MPNRPGRPGQGRPVDFSSGDFGFGSMYIQGNMLLKDSLGFRTRSRETRTRNASEVYGHFYFGMDNVFQDQVKGDQTAQDKEGQIGQDREDLEISSGDFGFGGMYIQGNMLLKDSLGFRTRSRETRTRNAKRARKTWIWK